MTSRLGTGKSLTFFYGVVEYVEIMNTFGFLRQLMNVIEEYEYLRVGKAKHVFAILTPEHKSNYDLFLIMDAE